jgi:hypothetical protein
MYVLPDLSVEAPSVRNEFFSQLAARSLAARFFHFKFVTNKGCRTVHKRDFLPLHDAMQQKQTHCKNHLKSLSQQQTKT